MWVQNLCSGLQVGQTEQFNLGDIPAGSHLPRKGMREVEGNQPPLRAPAGETAHPRSGGRHPTQPQIQSPCGSTSAKSQGDSFRRRAVGPGAEDAAAYRPEKFSEELQGQLRGSEDALMRKGRTRPSSEDGGGRDVQDSPPVPLSRPRATGARNLLAALQLGTSQHCLSVISAELK